MLAKQFQEVLSTVRKALEQLYVAQDRQHMTGITPGGAPAGLSRLQHAHADPRLRQMKRQRGAR